MTTHGPDLAVLVLIAIACAAAAALGLMAGFAIRRHQTDDWREWCEDAHAEIRQLRGQLDDQGWDAVLPTAARDDERTTRQRRSDIAKQRRKELLSQAITRHATQAAIDDAVVRHALAGLDDELAELLRRSDDQ